MEWGSCSPRDEGYTVALRAVPVYFGFFSPTFEKCLAMILAARHLRYMGSGVEGVNRGIRAPVSTRSDIAEGRLSLNQAREVNTADHRIHLILRQIRGLGRLALVCHLPHADAAVVQPILVPSNLPHRRTIYNHCPPAVAPSFQGPVRIATNLLCSAISLSHNL